MKTSKQSGNTLCTHEQVILFKKIPYWIYWFTIGVLGTVLGQFILRANNEKTFFWTSLMLGAGGVGSFPIALIWMARNFRSTYIGLSKIFWESQKECENWVENEFRKIFTLETLQVKIVTISIVIIALITVGIIGLPFKSSIVNFLGVSGFILFALICGQGAYISLNLLGTLSNVTKLKPNSPFYLSKPLPIISLLNYYSSVAIITTLGYIILTVAIWQGPYGFSFELQIWLAVLALVPLSMFFWSYYRVHIVLQRIKQNHLAVINQEVQRNLQKTLTENSLESADRLNKIMDIQKRIQETSEWPVDFQGTVTFLITMITATVQILLAVTGFFSP